MPSSVVRTFTEPDEYGAAFRGSSFELVVTGRGRLAGKLTQICFHDLWTQQIADNLSWVAQTVGPPGRSPVVFGTASGRPAAIDSVELTTSAAVCTIDGPGYFVRSQADSTLATMTLSNERMAEICGSLAGFERSATVAIESRTPKPHRMAKLQQLHQAAGSLAECAPEVIARPESARGLEQALILAMVDCLHPPESVDNRCSIRRHQIIMRRFYAAIADNSEEPLYVPDICAAVGVPQRTLHAICVETLGMGPKRYLLRRRMNLARQGLRKADPATTTVTDIAVRFGFWNFGRFAVEYKSLYGESPAATLRRRYGELEAHGA